MSDDNKAMHNPESSTSQLLECVFPGGVPPDDLPTLMYILKDDMSLRSVAHIAGLILGKDYTLVLSDVYRVASSSYTPDPQKVSTIKERLEQCGYREWLKEDS